LFLHGPTSWGHFVRLSHPSDVDDQIRASLCEALRRGDQETLDPDAGVVPITGRSLELFRTAFRARVEVEGEELMAKVPGHVAEALGLVDQVVARANGVELPLITATGARGDLGPYRPRHRAERRRRHRPVSQG
jgi:hypothetical protein